jgi:hypothetical protein
MSNTKQVKPIENTRDLRRFLVEQMEGVATGRVNTERAKSICNLSQQIYNSLNLEVKMAIARSKLKEGQDVTPVSFND